MAPTFYYYIDLIWTLREVYKYIVRMKVVVQDIFTMQVINYPEQGIDDIKI